MKRACFLLLFLAAPLTAQPVFEETSVDFGVIASGSLVSTVFHFENSGERALHITEVRPSCGCTIPGYTEESVGPGESGVVHVDYDSRGRHGWFRHSVVVLFDDGSGNPLQEVIFVEGRVVLEEFLHAVRQGGVEFGVDVFDAGLVESGTELAHGFLMHRIASRPLRIERVFVFPEGPEVTFPQREIFREEVALIRVTIPAELVTGEFDFAIALETDDEDEPVKLLRLTGWAE